MGIKYLIHAEECHDEKSKFVYKGSLLLEPLSQWFHSLRKPITLQQQQHSLKMTQSLPLIVNPHEFPENEKVLAKS